MNVQYYSILVNYLVKVLENTDYRDYKKQKTHTSQEDLEQNETDVTDVINKTITSFKINYDLTFNNFGNLRERSDNVPIEENKKFRWSLDISSIRKYRVGSFIFVAVSRIDVEKDMKKKKGKIRHV
ncbi:6855_t:CDS:1 [Funneliformis mosseae]|uniref:6855_t:CDS:1 n=1 Tax=Funneliformis mosseae TaxID=27381 RepID=A0A9N9C2G2_FUNMO|nr:6855_t:CDS:1 [Funneliformis mosseae]